MHMKADAESAKQQVQHLLSVLPDDCTIEDIQYHLYVLESIRAGEESLAKDGPVPDEEVRRRLAKWLTR